MNISIRYWSISISKNVMVDMGLSAFQVVVVFVFMGVAVIASTLKCQHYQADDTVQKNDGAEDYHEDHGDCEFLGGDCVGEG